MHAVQATRHVEYETRAASGNALRWFVGLAFATGVIVLGFLAFGGVLAGSEGGGEAAEPNGGECPSGFYIKGNESVSGSRIYHLPGWEYYDRTWPEECFASESAANAAGYRASKVR